MGRVIVPDVVMLEATRLPDKPWAKEIAAWFAAAAVEVVETETGALYRLALQQGLKPPRHAGEISIIEWLRDLLPGQAEAAMVVFEDPRVPRMVAGKTCPWEVALVSTFVFLELAEERGIILSADALWSAIVKAAPTASPISTRTTMKPSP